MSWFSVETCARCGQPMILVPGLGWTHVNAFDNVDHRAQQSPSSETGDDRD